LDEQADEVRRIGNALDLNHEQHKRNSEEVAALEHLLEQAMTSADLKGGNGSGETDCDCGSVDEDEREGAELLSFDDDERPRPQSSAEPPGRRVASPGPRHWWLAH
jgi:hypothetical protein